MTRLYIIVISIALLAQSVTSQTESSGVYIKADLLQIKLKRLYFNVGRESRIFPGTTYEFYQGDSLIHTGSIERSIHGVCYSQQLADTLIEQLSPMTETRLYPAEVDSSRSIRIGHANTIPFRLDTIGRPHDSIYTRYDSPFQMVMDFQNGQIDGYLSYSYPESVSPTQIVQSSPAPFIIAILPSLSKSNRQPSFISTAMYYRFDSDNLHFYFEGDDLLSHDCLTLPLDSCNRLYPYSPRRFSSLLETMSPKIDTIRINISDRLLITAATYFSDILARERIRAIVSYEGSNGNLLITTLRYDDSNPLVSLRHIHEILSNMPYHSKSDDESLELVAHYLDEAEKDLHTDVALHYLRLAQSELRDNLGVFPLLRPTLFFVSTDNLAGFNFDENGYPDFSSSVLLKLPEYKKESER